jgi:hypothetical protein
MADEKRKRFRAHAGFEVTVHLGKEKAMVHTINISMTGLLCTSDQLFQKGASCRLKLALNPDAKVTVRGKILRSDPRETAISFTSMDEASFSHLKNLVAYNTGDADKIEKELRQTGFISKSA